MSNFNSDFKNVLKNLENNVKDKEALEIAKVEIFNLYNLFFDEITEIEQTMNKKILAIAESQLHVEEEIKNMNKSIKNIEKDIYKYFFCNNCNVIFFYNKYSLYRINIR